jgi:hypothetical protein
MSSFCIILILRPFWLLDAVPNSATAWDLRDAVPDQAPPTHCDGRDIDGIDGGGFAKKNANQHDL